MTCVSLKLGRLVSGHFAAGMLICASVGRLPLTPWALLPKFRATLNLPISMRHIIDRFDAKVFLVVWPIMDTTLRCMLLCRFDALCSQALQTTVLRDSNIDKIRNNQVFVVSPSRPGASVNSVPRHECGSVKTDFSFYHTGVHRFYMGCAGQSNV